MAIRPATFLVVFSISSFPPFFIQFLRIFPPLDNAERSTMPNERRFVPAPITASIPAEAKSISLPFATSFNMLPPPDAAAPPMAAIATPPMPPVATAKSTAAPATAPVPAPINAPDKMLSPLTAALMAPLIAPLTAPMIVKKKSPFSSLAMTGLLLQYANILHAIASLESVLA